MRKRFTYKGRFSPKNPKKYRGDVKNIVFRSMWERRFMKYCDSNPSVVQWSSEEVIIPYLSPIDKKVHRYFPDFLVKVRTPEDKIKTILIEVKPKKETRPPKKRKNGKKSFQYLEEVKTWGINDAKWKAAREYCADRQWEFRILTEDHLVP